MKTKDLALAAILLAIGLVLHSLVPPIFGGVKPDFLLATMVIAILSQPKLRNTLIIGAAAGILAALTTGFPGGQIPNIIDKLASAVLTLVLIKATLSVHSMFVLGLISGVITLFSGMVFLTSALLIVGLPAPLSTLFVIVVIPTAIANALSGAILFKLFQPWLNLNWIHLQP
ncbi:MAG: hypothetical protein LRY28_03095 [Erysipelotrichaceae bacterium]|nr:hypothetical protein [Erysipelotrichaceae bacterium]